MSLPYITKLVGSRPPKPTVREVDQEESTSWSYLQFDTMARQVDNGSPSLDDQLFTDTVYSQKEVEEQVKAIYDQWLESGDVAHLFRDKHIKYLKMVLGPVPHVFQALDASQPWMIYWSCNALSLMGYDIDKELKASTVKKLLSFQDPRGGFGGGLGQLPHVAATYASILALCLAGDEDSWSLVDRQGMYRWLLTLKQQDGSFVMHSGGEVDTRAVYCALVVASLLDIITPELVEGTAEWLWSCQTHEGGFGGVPWDEAHGGYTYCAVGALLILGKVAFERVNLAKLSHWIVSRQMPLEGGFCGRTNKLVDGCYSFWVGGLTAILDIFIQDETINRASLNNYILCCCQNERFGGLKDKPSKNADFYHSNYVLSGLAVIQNKFSLGDEQFTGVDSMAYSIASQPVGGTSLKVDATDRLKPINPVFALPEGFANKMKSYYVS